MNYIYVLEVEGLPIAFANKAFRIPPVLLLHQFLTPTVEAAFVH